MKKLKIGVDAVPLVRLTSGVGYYIFHLLDHLIKQKKECAFILYSHSDQGDIAHFKQYPNVQIRKIPFLAAAHSIWSQTTLAFYAWKDHLDVFWGSTQSIPLWKRKKMHTILTLYDFVYLLFPEMASPMKCLYQKIFCPKFLNAANYILPISFGTAERLKQFYGKGYCDVVAPPIKPEMHYKNKNSIVPLLSIHGLKYNHYLVTVGTLEPRKNFVSLIQAYIQILKKNNKERILPLVIIGSGGWKNKKILQALHEAQEQYPKHIKLMGHVSNEDLSSYLSGARYYLMLSVYEGYGMPIAEARCCRTPVICLDVPEMKEAAENDGIFIKNARLEQQLEIALLDCQKNSEEEKPQLSIQYASNEEKALKLAKILTEIQKNLDLRHIFN